MSGQVKHTAPDLPGPLDAAHTAQTRLRIEHETSGPPSSPSSCVPSTLLHAGSALHAGTMMSQDFLPSLRRQVTHTHTHTQMKWAVAVIVNGVNGTGMDGGVCGVEVP